MSETENNQGSCFVDTNIWLYAFVKTQDSKKSAISSPIIQEKEIIISTQIISEALRGAILMTGAGSIKKEIAKVTGYLIKQAGYKTRVCTD